jgi:hypothetical protein
MTTKADQQAGEGVGSEMADSTALAGQTVPGEALKHTPGPWWVTDYGIRNSGGYIVAIVHPTRYPEQAERFAMEVAERKADALLVAAAPELLEALRRLEVAANTADYCYRNRPENFAVALRELEIDAATARAAIAKATGAAS